MSGLLVYKAHVRTNVITFVRTCALLDAEIPYSSAPTPVFPLSQYFQKIPRFRSLKRVFSFEKSYRFCTPFGFFVRLRLQKTSKGLSVLQVFAPQPCASATARAEQKRSNVLCALFKREYERLSVLYSLL